MNKIAMAALFAVGLAFSAFGAQTQYKVYDLRITMTSTKAKGETTTSCGERYVYRTKATRKIEGVVAGCGCSAAAGDPTCDNFAIYLWDATDKVQLTNFTYKTELIQRIDKTGNVVEHVATLVVEDQDGEKFELMLAGFGTYVASKKDKMYDYVSIGNGYVAGTVDAPYKTKLEKCQACFYEPGSVDQTTAAAICEDGVCTKSDTGDVTPACGIYSFKYNGTKAQRCEKKGVTKSTLGLPSYVNF